MWVSRLSHFTVTRHVCVRRRLRFHIVPVLITQPPSEKHAMRQAVCFGCHTCTLLSIWAKSTLTESGSVGSSGM